MNTTKPKYNILAVKTVGERDHYTRIGVAFPLEKGGFNILFDALPTNGRVLLLPERERSASGEVLTNDWPVNPEGHGGQCSSRSLRELTVYASPQRFKARPARLDGASGTGQEAI